MGTWRFLFIFGKNDFSNRSGGRFTQTSTNRFNMLHFFINATEFMLMEDVFLRYGDINHHDLGQLLHINIPRDSVVRIHENYDISRFWTFDFATGYVESHNRRVIEFKSRGSAEAMLVFMNKVRGDRPYHLHRLKSVRNQGGFVDCHTLQTVWPNRCSSRFQLFGNGLAMLSAW